MLFWRGRHEVREADLSAYVDGELNASALQRVEAHLEVCAACRESVTELRAVRQSVKELPRAPVPRSFVLREADVAAAPTRAGGGLFGSVTPLLSGVAVIALVAFVVLAGFDITSDTSNRDAGITVGDFSTSDLDVESASEVPADAVVPQTSEREGYNAGDDGLPGELSPDDGEAVPPQLEGIRDENTDPGTDPQSAVASGDDDETGLRIAEALAGGIAVVAGGAALFIWWRRRQAGAI